jgi:hypothetical protein
MGGRRLWIGGERWPILCGGFGWGSLFRGFTQKIRKPDERTAKGSAHNRAVFSVVRGREAGGEERAARTEEGCSLSTVTLFCSTTIAQAPGGRGR